MKDYIFVKGAKEHNLKNIDVKIPRDKFVVITGLSGSGKSSLAFDTIYAEGQRRYVESLSSYARQFLGQMEKPNVEYIEGLSPAISIDQKTTNRNPRSTVGTVTEIYDYLRLLFARAGTPHCPICGKLIESTTIDQIVDQVMEIEEGSKIQIIAPVVRGKKGTHKNEIQKYIKDGYIRARIDGERVELNEDIELSKNKKHTIEIVIDRLVIKEGIESRLSDSVETSLKLTEGTIIINILDNEDILFNTNFACPDHGVGISEMEPRMFSFNAPYGSCENCKGIGYLQEVDPKLIIPNKKLSIREGAIAPFMNTAEGTYYHQMIRAIINDHGIEEGVPLEEMPEKLIDEILYGTGSRKIRFMYESKYGGTREFFAPFEGIVNNLERRYKETNSDYIREKIEEYMSLISCSSCHGKKLKDEVLAVTVGGLNIYEVTELPVRNALVFFENLELSAVKMKIADQIVKEIIGRLMFLKNVGLDYLSLSRSANTLSGGESQRIRLATQIGSGLVGVLYILDEPSIGLHQKDNRMLLDALRNLTNIGNTLIVVEHDEETITDADHVIDVGPGAGEHGGYIVAEGTVDDIKNNSNSVTGDYLSGRKCIEVPSERKRSGGNYLEIVGACENNLKQLKVKIPLGIFTCVTGVSGSGKSSLINEVLFKGIYVKINKRSRLRPGEFDTINGVENIDKVIDIDQSPIGRTPRSNPATYTGVFDHIRDLFGQLPESKIRGYKKGRFSFNVKGGRCEACRGDGINKIEMHFLPDVYVQCEICKGKRYNRETLEVKYKGKNISQVLDMNVEEALSFFNNIPKIKNKLKTLKEVGLGYIKLGQPSTQLSGGEAQRIKLATELSKRSTGKTLYILDEPTTGLHMADVHMLIDVIHRLVESGNTVVIIEHNLDVIKSADYIIDLGPEGGDRGGQIVVEGTPEYVASYKTSYTGQYLKRML
ncbi:MAG: excinuclease ABC subunit UvrA [Bacillota bacterium]|nr:excinuclease ABC subunit UvrA [Bacillota bacterium]